ncbi:hypothetical protein [Anaerorhabdus furcosa]|uniref:Phosphoenolpyruvate carboxykinase (ATP) n=1 Tax=Anaerorhabdus furcosa TaxID=118967 RepID=A0A1T4JW23_9FIRM|nr:hypothetical protein [Anaerorhabdus furcosa]SJZ34400.1 hypothetical protein SAMN02745191_0130 [Anaerorhabdus furcosa]
MKEAFYLKNNLAIVNYTTKYCKTGSELISSEGFDQFLDAYLQFLMKDNQDLYLWLTNNASEEEVKSELIRLAKILLVLEMDEINHPALNDPKRLLDVIESMYQFWRQTQRISIVYSKHDEGLQLANFLEADNDFNDLVLKTYRRVQQKVQGSNNRVFRQLQAGTNASMMLCTCDWDMPKEYEMLNKTPFVHTLMLRTPLIIHPKSNKRTGTFTEVLDNPISDYVDNHEDWICFPCKVGSLLTFIFFHRDFSASAISLANLFELASQEECIGKKPDCIMIFGNEDGKKDTVFYHDKPNQIWVGKISYEDKIEYFGYLKKMALTLHNLAMMEKNWLPIHGAMINLHLKDGTKKGIMFMGDSGAGKSETIEALTNLAKSEIDYQEVVFDDMGTLHLDHNGKIVAQGTEIGAFVRLDDLDRGSAYRDMDRSIFFNPESSNSRVVIPAAPYSVVTTNQTVDMFMYANNYTDSRGLRIIEDQEEAKQIFVEGKRFALGTTQEKGLSTTFFANPFGPMQKQEQCTVLIDKMFEELYKQNILVGEIYTCLGLPDKGDHGIDEAAKALLALVKQHKD